ncbi:MULTISPECIES: CDP-diacylglycerol--serine O-phosphatidyltransferase [Piscirickettsiaceae]|jgi:CDP-diacylglycerol--serine O-phosphatidyltransferase (EC 2.7.8.8)|uniref:CDP-diacylglycerol--serine O-phosphatidyltransferase n=1 Tax=Hydrogenovibrio thermophilus TaxID=265883 RepID=A0A410H1N6_9GAMM|nr:MULTISPECIES: CDP-diacylglycerol--serine O-phosphatidyltransferase [Piscirickettsiaceae]AZR82597.1 CDP-diacylglycerol--serine O-phosphatidyltransferase [Thiomicrospira sp. S5]QAB14840.1 CDP-diacylglycerol--serine O-phosphatidyltransferase [Hydrogenovibrio thermophilus]
MKPFEKGIYLLPNLMTTLALFAGFYAVIAGMNGQFELGAIAIFVAMIFDGLDGRVARMTNSCSAFGAEYDSLADMVSFGLAPALLVYQWALQDFGKLGWLIAFIFTVGAALRLARFNTQVGIADKRYFQGLPSPAAAALLAGFVWMIETNHIETGLESLAVLLLTLVAGLMMVSNIRFSSFKELNLKDKVPFVTLLVVVLVFVVITLKPAMILFILFFGYTLSGPVMTLKQLQQKRALRRQAKSQAKPEKSPATEPQNEPPTEETSKE